MSIKEDIPNAIYNSIFESALLDKGTMGKAIFQCGRLTLNSSIIAFLRVSQSSEESEGFGLIWISDWEFSKGGVLCGISESKWEFNDVSSGGERVSSGWEGEVIGKEGSRVELAIKGT